MAIILKSLAAKAEAAKMMKVGQTTAKAAIIPPKKGGAKAAKAIAKNQKWERPNLNALCRKLAGGDMAAGMLLFHILYVWRNRRGKLERNSKEWLAHSREAWAEASGLTLYEFRDRALPRLKDQCHEFLTITAMGNGTDKKLWVSVDETALYEMSHGAGAFPWDMFWAALNGIGPGNEKSPNNYYSKAV
jgi:hypothetical protein